MQTISDGIKDGNMFLYAEFYTEQQCWDEFFRSFMSLYIEKMFNETCVDRNMFWKMYEIQSSSITWNKWADDKIEEKNEKYVNMAEIIKHILDPKQHSLAPVFNKFNITIKPDYESANRPR